MGHGHAVGRRAGDGRSPSCSRRSACTGWRSRCTAATTTGMAELDGAGRDPDRRRRDDPRAVRVPRAAPARLPRRVPARLRLLAGASPGCASFAAEVAAAGKVFTPHTWGNGIGVLANLHLTAGTVGAPFIEFPFDPPEWSHGTAGLPPDRDDRGRRRAGGSPSPTAPDWGSRSTRRCSPAPPVRSPPSPDRGRQPAADDVAQRSSSRRSRARYWGTDGGWTLASLTRLSRCRLSVRMCSAEVNTRYSSPRYSAARTGPKIVTGAA